MPSMEEITRLRALISRVTAGLGDLTSAERAEVDGPSPWSVGTAPSCSACPAPRYPASFLTCPTAAQPIRDGRHDRAAPG